MKVKDIVTKYLKNNGFGGLVGENCDCKLGDLMPCEASDGGGISDCEPGHVIEYPSGAECPCGDACYFHVFKEKP